MVPLHGPLHDPVASREDRPLCETLLAARQLRPPRLCRAGQATASTLLVDKGFAGAVIHERWNQQFRVRVITAPHQRSTREHPWSKLWRRWLTRLRQPIETVFEKLLNTFRLMRERPHTLSGFRARLAAKVGLHNFCIWLNHTLGRYPLACADLFDW
ncbi:MAG TPA: transposase [Ktedonobacteraceae bacterium]